MGVCCPPEVRMDAVLTHTHSRLITAELVIIHPGAGGMHPGCKKPGLMHPTLVNDTHVRSGEISVSGTIRIMIIAVILKAIPT